MEPRAMDPGADADTRREQLVMAAYSVIAEVGLEGLRTRMVAGRAGVNISTLHYYFATKEILLAAVVEFAREYFAGLQREILLHPQMSADRTLAWMLEAQDLRRNEAPPALYQVLQELAMRARRDSAIAEALTKMHVDWDRRVEELLRRGVLEGVFRDDLMPELVAPLVTSFLIGAQVKLSINAESFQRRATCEQLLRFLSKS
jgi:AcrR family transcriptional regulator